MNQTVELLRRTRELLLDVQVELTRISLQPQGKPRKRAIKAKLNGGGK